MNITSTTLSSWFNYIREAEDPSRFTECFWESQLKSKQVILNYMSSEDVYTRCIYIFGGWYGILAHLIDDNVYCTNIKTIDIDPECKEIFDKYFSRSNIVSEVCDMKDYSYSETPSIIINTSTEHVDQETYDSWFANIPNDVPYILQGNNLHIPEHIRTTETFEEFVQANKCDKILFKDVTVCPGPDGDFNRYTVVGIK